MHKLSTGRYVQRPDGDSSQYPAVDVGCLGPASSLGPRCMRVIVSMVSHRDAEISVKSLGIVVAALMALAMQADARTQADAVRPAVI